MKLDPKGKYIELMKHLYPLLTHPLVLCTQPLEVLALIAEGLEGALISVTVPRSSRLSVVVLLRKTNSQRVTCSP